MSSRISASAFLDAYTNYLRETYPDSISVLDMFSSGKLLPTPTVQAITRIVQTHLALNLQKKNQETINKFEADKEKPSKGPSGMNGSGRYSVQFYIKVVNERTQEASIEVYTDKDGNHTFLADMFQNANHLVDRRQNEMMNSVYAVITSMENGKALSIIIPRADSVARANRKGKGPAVRNTGSSNSKPFQNYMRARNDTCSFSRG